MPSGASGDGRYVPRPSAWLTIVLGGSLAGVLDILDAIAVTTLNGGSPTRMLQYIASGAMGPAAFDGGAATAALGLLCHFTIALGAAATYAGLSTRWPALLRRPVLNGVVFGLGVWAFMRWVVLPSAGLGATAWPSWPMLLNQWMIHALGVGVPIAAVATWSARRQRVSRRSA